MYNFKSGYSNKVVLECTGTGRNIEAGKIYQNAVNRQWSIMTLQKEGHYLN